jgi:hypothetical protein
MEKRMPRCLGAYEADDPQCDGNPVGKTAPDRAPCVYRDRCAGFIQLMKLTSRPREFYVREAEEPDARGNARAYTYANAADFDAKLLEQIEAFGIQNGRATLTKPVKIRPPKKAPKTKPKDLSAKGKKPPKSVTRAGAKARDRALDKGREQSQQVAHWFVKKLQERLKRKLAAFEEAARPGDLYLVDKIETSGYCAVYCKGKGSRRHAVSSFQYKPVTGKLEIRLAAAFADFAKAVPKASVDALKPIDYTGRDGAFKIRFREVDNGDASAIALGLGQTYRRFDPGFPEAKGEE